MTHAVAISYMYDESDDVNVGTNEHTCDVAEIFDCEASRIENTYKNDDSDIVGLPEMFDGKSDKDGSFSSHVPPSFSSISGIIK